MIREELVEKVAKRLEWSQEKTSDIIDTITNIIKAELKINNPVNIDDFGVFETEIQPEYILVDPESHDRYLMPPSVDVVLKTVSQQDKGGYSFNAGFSADETLYTDVNSSFSSFEPSLLNKGVQFPGIIEIIAEDPKEENVDESVIEHEEEKQSYKTDWIDEVENQENINITQSSDTSEKDIQSIQEQSGVLSEDEIVAQKVNEENVESVELTATVEPIDATDKSLNDQSPETVNSYEIDKNCQNDAISDSVEEIDQIAHITPIRKEAIVQMKSDTKPNDIPAQDLYSPKTDQLKRSPHQIGSHRQRKSHKRTLSVWVPIAGGIAIIMASLFFFKGEAKDR